ncbi:ribosomal protein S18-alanine N-acetyltransferase [Sneathiella sp.]|uniref:ribosomal protein S18-alanine N-acetyltransferase n=1 Tax=Sneathiella sp. TaxID=1964365 RepID=UPI00261F428B|nr:ribosomal protein S18-alanine N-acetyltransferase [Sneathiella sp.]MDF2366999.1 ribosomal protein S18-alanine N-acetyltransferase [Sneathiella sp.]
MQEDNISIDFFTDESAVTLAAEMHARCFAAGWSEAEFTSALGIQGTLLQILSRDGEPAAFSLYRIVSDEAEILTLGTLPEFRNQGIATQLLDVGIKKLKTAGVRFLHLEVGSQNFTANRLYVTEGFQKIGLRRNYYNHGGKREDAIMMKKIL